MVNNFALHPFCCIFVMSKQRHMARHNEMGKWGEDVVAAYLRQKGYVIRERDWRSGKRDIDIIALTPDSLTVVFVEVKTRLPDSVTAPEDAVDAVKIRNLCVAADNYVKMYGVEEELRFDIITVVGTRGCEPRIEHIEDAFNPLLII